jgi:NitT/TauT family transport system substrate-binding protein
VGWAAPPFGLKEIEEGKIRVVAKATDAALVRGQTIRVIVANAQALDKKKDAIHRFLQGYRETIEHMYGSDPQVIKDYAEFVNIPEPLARKVRDEFFPKALLSPDQINGLDSLMEEAVTLKFIPASLTKAQQAELIQIQAPATR